jgi:hypothetical protein
MEDFGEGLLGDLSGFGDFSYQHRLRRVLGRQIDQRSQSVLTRRRMDHGEFLV